MPPKSKSGTIRSAIGLSVSRLGKHHSEAKALLRATPTEGFIIQVETASSKLDTSIKSLEEKDEKWQRLIRELDDDEMDAEEELYQKTAYAPTDSYAALLEEAKETLGLLAVARELNRSTKVAPATSSTTTPKSGNSTTAKLPKLQLPVFNGDYLEWDHFWSIFNTNIHQSSLTGSEKFAYLQGQLTGPALRTIDGVAVSDGNYEAAVALLKARYERLPEQMICSYYSQLMRLPASSMKIPDMIRTYDACERIFRQLEKAGEDIETNRASVLQLFSKFPNCVVKDLFNQFGVDSTAKLGQLRTALGKYIRRSEDLGEIFNDLEPYDTSKSKERTKVECASEVNSEASKTTLQQTSTLAAVESKPPSSRAGGRRNNPQSPCYFCNGSHFNSQCSEYPSANQRIERMKSLGKCVRCMSSTHMAEDCRTPPQKVWCFFCQTNGKHPSALCTHKFCAPDTDAAKTTSAAIVSEVVGITTSSSTLLNSEEKSLLLTACTTVTNPKSGEQTKLRLLLDSGSHRSYITERCAQMLRLHGGPSSSLNVAVFGSKRTLSVDTVQVSFDILLRNGSSTSITANTTPLITSCNIVADRLPEKTIQYINSMKFDLADDYTSNFGGIDILIGSDFRWEFITGARKEIPGGIYLIPSTLGYLLSGRYIDESSAELQPVLLCLTDVSRVASSPINANMAVAESKTSTQYPDIDEYWSLEKIGITDNPAVVDDDKALQQFSDTIDFKEGRYQVCWPWKDNKCQLPTNYGLAYGRLASAMKKFRSGDRAMLQKYQQIIDDQVNKGVVELVDNVESTHPVHYLPHHPVVKPGSNTTKVRIVYDASSKSRRGELSLNECLYRGPVLLPDLCGILIRFRMNKVAVIADIEKAYLQIALQPSERDVTRFLWVKDPSNPELSGNILIYRFCRVPFGVNSSQFLLGGTLQYHLNRVGTPIAILISRNMYVDNVLASVKDEAMAIQLYEASKLIFRQAGMNLQEWSSNSPLLNSSIPECDKGRDGDVKVLGMTWNTDEDTIRMQNEWIGRAICKTKRQVMKATASIFDPLGLYQPCTLGAKCFLRKLWSHKVDWDVELSESLQTEWSQIHASIAPLFNIRVNRHVPMTDKSTIVAFCDASVKAYATAIYLRTPTDDDPTIWSSQLIFAKSRLTPAKFSGKDGVTLPRLELLGVVIGVRAAKFVRSELQDGSGIKIHVLTDSTCVLHWLQSSRPLSTFVSNRVKEVRALVNVEFHHVSSQDNPADLGTRGVSGSDLGSCGQWWKGPVWLALDAARWPAISAVRTVSDADLKLIECEYSKQPIFHTTLAGEALGLDPSGPFEINPTRYSCVCKLLRVTAWCIKFVTKLTGHISNGKKSFGAIPTLVTAAENPFVTADEVRHAEQLWVKYVQSEAYGDVIAALKANKPHQLLHQLNLASDDDGVLRCYSRLQLADLPLEAASPKLLPKQHVITRMIIKDTHEERFHAGVAHTLAQIRRKFWIPQGRHAVRKVITKCVPCRKLKGHPFQLPKMPPWPKERVARSTPFRFTGVDYLGPITVKVNEVPQKMWVALFTCLAIRAVHLEWVFDCSAQSFLDCMIRFTSRRGFPEEIISDDGAQFRTTSEVFGKMWQDTLADGSVTSYAANTGIRWKFITALAPWQGGYYERLVGVVKQAFRSAVGRRLLTLEQFTTVIAEVEAIVNSRPLTYVYEDSKSGMVLRPIDFITDLPAGRPTLAPATVPTGGDACRNLIRHWKYQEKRLNSLWHVWYEEYLLSLRERGNLKHRGGRKDILRSPNINEVVVVKEADAPRGVWKLGKVVRLIRSRDEVTRSVEVLLPNRAVIQRSVHHLYPLEVDGNAGDIVAPDSIPETERAVAPIVDSAVGNGSDNDAFDGFDLSEVEDAQRRIRVLHDLRMEQSNVAVQCSSAANNDHDSNENTGPLPGLRESPEHKAFRSKLIADILADNSRSLEEKLLIAFNEGSNYGDQMSRIWPQPGRTCVQWINLVPNSNGTTWVRTIQSGYSMDQPPKRGSGETKGVPGGDPPNYYDVFYYDDESENSSSSISSSKDIDDDDDDDDNVHDGDNGISLSQEDELESEFDMETLETMEDGDIWASMMNVLDEYIQDPDQDEKALHTLGLASNSFAANNMPQIFPILTTSIPVIKKKRRKTWCERRIEARERGRIRRAERIEKREEKRRIRLAKKMAKSQKQAAKNFGFFV